jgi:hypothetical protein
VRELDGAPPLAPDEARETLALDARGLRRILAENMEHLVARKMLVDGLERAAAEAELDGLRLALGSFAGLRVELVSDDPGAPVLRLALPFEGEAR